MKKQVIKFWDNVIVLLLGLAGVFSGCKPNAGGCESRSDLWINPPSYSDSVIISLLRMPPADFVIKGTVTSKTNGKPVPNIAVVKQMEDNQTMIIGFSNSEGNYYIDEYYFSGKEDVIYLKFEDIDGKENGGNFATQEIKVKITNADRGKIEKCKQDDGIFTKTQNIELKTKK